MPDTYRIQIPKGAALISTGNGKRLKAPSDLTVDARLRQWGYWFFRLDGVERKVDHADVTRLERVD